jgi:hypothetical protein
MLITKHFDAIPPQGCGDHSRIHTKIVIPKDGVHAIPRPKAAQDFCGRLNFRAGIGNEVAGEHNDIRTQPIRLLNRLAQPVFR